MYALILLVIAQNRTVGNWHFKDDEIEELLA